MDHKISPILAQLANIIIAVSSSKDLDKELFMCLEGCLSIVYMLAERRVNHEKYKCLEELESSMLASKLPTVCLRQL